MTGVRRWEVADPRGKAHIVVLERSGLPLRQGASGDSGLSIVVELLQLMVGWTRHKAQFKGGWTMAVLLPEKGLRGEQTVFKRLLPTEDAARTYALELVNQIETSGMI
jgi:hypothetical protein